jgi:hypothetical protein
MVATDGRRLLCVDRLGAKPETVLRRAARQVVEVTALHTEPHRAHLGDLGALIAAHQRSELLEPAAVVVPGKGYMIIGGERRVAAARATGARFITLYAIRTWQEFFAWLLLDEKATRAHEASWTGPPVRHGMNYVDAAYWVRKVMTHLVTRKNDQAERVMAEYIDLDVVRIREVKYQLRWVGEDVDAKVRTFATEQLRLVASGQAAPGTIGNRITRFADGQQTMPVKQQRAILAAASGQCAGLADALRPLALALTDELADQEIESALKHLSEGRLQVERVIRALNAIRKGRGTT